MITALRFSHQGKVCSGDFLKNDDPKFNDDTKVYYMRYEGAFVIFMLIYVGLSVVSFLIMYCRINDQIDYDDVNLMATFVDNSELQTFSKAFQLVLDQFKFDPNESKYEGLRYIETI